MSLSTLDQLGWSSFYSQALTLEDLAAAEPARVTEVQRSGLMVHAERGVLQASVPPGRVAPDGVAATVGDWVLVERTAPRVQRILQRRSLIARRAPGSEARIQPIAANVDTLFVVTSCNADFNPSRLERYFTIARHAQVPTVLLLTKSDLCSDPDEFVTRARAIDGGRDVLALDACAPASAQALAPWLGEGRTVAFAGSSGVGKSTLVNTLLRGAAQKTAAIREDDGRGRHTTTARRMFRLPHGAWVIDTPGMRELAIGSAAAAVDDTFDDLTLLARRCRFRDCAHRGDVGCALGAAAAAGTLDARRLVNYLKLQDEASRAVRTEAQRRASERRFGRLAREVLRDKRKRRDLP